MYDEATTRVQIGTALGAAAVAMAYTTVIAAGAALTVRHGTGAWAISRSVELRFAFAGLASVFASACVAMRRAWTLRVAPIISATAACLDVLVAQTLFAEHGVVAETVGAIALVHAVHNVTACVVTVATRARPPASALLSFSATGVWVLLALVRTIG